MDDCCPEFKVEEDPDLYGECKIPDMVKHTLDTILELERVKTRIDELLELSTDELLELESTLDELLDEL